MKRFRPLLIGLAVALGLLAASVAVVFSSRFQTWAVRKTIAGRADVTGTVEAVSAGLKRVEIRNARIERQGAVLMLPSATVDLPLMDAGLKKKITVTRFVAKGWVLDLTQLKPGNIKAPSKTVQLRDFSLLNSAYAATAPIVSVPPSTATEIFRGVFPLLQLPVDLSVDGVELEGEIILPPMQGQPPAHVKVALIGGGLGAGRQGKFTYDLTANSGAGVAPISAHGLHGILTAEMDTAHSFGRIASKAEASVSGTQFPRGVKLNVDLVVARDASGESYDLTFADGEKQIAIFQAGFPFEKPATAATGKLGGTWKLNLRDPDLAPFLLGVALPVFEVVGEGDFETDAAFKEIRNSGKIDATAEKLANYLPELAPVGSVRLAAIFALARRGEMLRIERFSADLAGAKPIASIRALQSFEFNSANRELTANPAQDLFGMILQGVPLAWTKSFLPGWTVTGGDLQGEFVGSAGPDGLVLKPKRPLTISNLSVAQEKKPLLNAVDLSLTASADYTPQGWQAVVSSFTAKNGAATLLTFDGKAGQLAGKDRPVKATGKLAVNVPAVLSQPVAQGLMQFTGGDATLEFSTSIGLKQELHAKLAMQDLAVAPKISSEKLPVITADLRADREADGKISLSLPMLMERAGRKSDLSITGSLSPEKAGYVVDAHAASERLVINDVKILTVPFGPEKESATPAKNPPRDTVPFWQGITGKLTLALKRIVYSEEFQVADVTGTLRLAAGAMKLETVRAGMGESGEMKLSGALQFDAKVMEPYSLAAQFALENFDSLPLFRAFDPSKPATVEGKFNVASQLNGTGANLSALAAQTKGDVQLISKSGIFRGLRSDTAEAIKAAPSTLSGIVTGIGSLLGKDIAEKAEKLGTDINKRGKSISDIAAALAEIPYDQLSVSLVRDASLNVELKDFTLISPEVRLGGTGIVAYQPDVPLLMQALDLQLQLGVRGKLAEQVKRASLLGEAQDSLGYVAFAFPVRVGGSLANPDVSDLKREFVKAAASIIGR